MASLIYQVSVGPEVAHFEPCIESVARYCARHGIDHYVQREPILRIAPLKSARSENALRLGYLPIYEKQAAFRWLDRWDQVAIIDADVYARETAPNIFHELGTAAFGAVLERDMPLTPAYRDKIRKHSDGQFSTLTDVDWQWKDGTAAYYNMGVMVLGPRFKDYLNGQTPEQFLRRPEFERFVNGEGHWRWSTDQTLMNYFVRKSGMYAVRLDWRWNALYGACRDVSEAYFVHFFLSAKLPQGGKEVGELIKRI